MVVFIDESGTHKPEEHSTIAVVYVEVTNLAEFDEQIKKIEEDLRLNSFHWSEERWVVRNKFLERILKLNFEVKVAIFKNPINPEKMTQLVFRHLITETKIRNIFIDAKKPKWYELSLKKALRNKGVSVKKLKSVNDVSYPGIQVADCLAGLVRRYYDNIEEEYPKKWFNKLKDSKKLKIRLLFEE